MSLLKNDEEMSLIRGSEYCKELTGGVDIDKIGIMGSIIEKVEYVWVRGNYDTEGNKSIHVTKFGMKK